MVRKPKKEVHKQLHKHTTEGEWESRRQALAVGLSETRRKGTKVPPPPDDTR